MEEKHFEFQAGILLYGTVRDILEDEKFQGRKIRWREGRGFISRIFTIIGDPNDVDHAFHRLLALQKRLDAV